MGIVALVLWSLRDRLTGGRLFALYLVLAGARALPGRVHPPQRRGRRRPDAAAAAVARDDRRRRRAAGAPHATGAARSLHEPAPRGALHLFALTSFAVAQPLFAKLGPAPQYFAAHGVSVARVGRASRSRSCVVPPLVLCRGRGAGGSSARASRWVLHLVLRRRRSSRSIALPSLGGARRRVARVSALAAVARSALAYARVAACARSRRARVAPALFLALFLLVSPTSRWSSATARRLARRRLVPPAGRLHPVRRAAEPAARDARSQGRRGALSRTSRSSRATAPGTATRRTSTRTRSSRCRRSSTGNIPKKGAHAGRPGPPAEPVHAARPGLRDERGRGGDEPLPARVLPAPQPTTGCSRCSATRACVFNQIVRPEDAARRRCRRSTTAGRTSTPARCRRGVPAREEDPAVRHPPSALRPDRSLRALAGEGRAAAARCRSSTTSTCSCRTSRASSCPTAGATTTPDGALEGPPAYDKTLPVRAGAAARACCSSATPTASSDR